MSPTRKLLLLMMLMSLKIVLCCQSVAVMSMSSTHMLDFCWPCWRACPHHVYDDVNSMLCTWSVLSCHCWLLTEVDVHLVVVTPSMERWVLIDDKMWSGEPPRSMITKLLLNQLLMMNENSSLMILVVQSLKSISNNCCRWWCLLLDVDVDVNADDGCLWKILLKTTVWSTPCCSAVLGAHCWCNRVLMHPSC